MVPVAFRWMEELVSGWLVTGTASVGAHEYVAEAVVRGSVRSGGEILSAGQGQTEIVRRRAIGSVRPRCFSAPSERCPSPDRCR